MWCAVIIMPRAVARAARLRGILRGCPGVRRAEGRAQQGRRAMAPRRLLQENHRQDEHLLLEDIEHGLPWLINERHTAPAVPAA